MRITDNDKKFGFFWIPSNTNEEPKDKHPGLLCIQDGGKVQLELFTSSSIKLNRKTSRIIGILEKFGPVTLDNCLYYNISNSSGIKKYILSVEKAFVGVQYSINEEPQFNTFSFSVEGLHYWITKTGIKNSNDYSNNKFTIRYDLPESISYKIDEDTEILFGLIWKQHPKIDINCLSLEITENVCCKLMVSKKQALDTLISIARKISSFLYFVMDQVVCIKDVKATSDDIQENLLTGIRPVDIKLFYKNRPFIKTLPKNIWPLFDFEFMQKNATQALNKWMNLYDKTYPAFELYLSTQTGEHIFLEDRFLTLVKFIERYLFSSKDMQLKTSLTKFIEPLKTEEIISIDNEQKFIKDIIDIRNYFTHYNPKNRSQVLYDDLYLLYVKLEGIIQLVLLKQLGFSSSQIKYIVSNHHNLKKKIEYLSNKGINFIK